MADWNEIRTELTRWLGWAPGERWRGYELQVTLASDIQNDRMLLEFQMDRRRGKTLLLLLSAFYHRATKRDILEVYYGEDKDAVTELNWADVRDSLIAGNLDLVRDGMPVLSCAVVEGIRTVRFYQDGDVVATMWAEPFVAMLDDFYVNQSDRIEEV